MSPVNATSSSPSAAEAGDTFGTQDAAAKVEEKSSALTEKESALDDATSGSEANSMNFPSSAADRTEGRQGQGMNLDTKHLNSFSNKDAEESNSAGAATLEATQEADSGPFSGGGRSGAPANDRMKVYE